MYPEDTTTVKSAPHPGKKKHFTVEEANRALPYVSRVVRDLVRVYREASKTRKQADETHDDQLTQDLLSEYDRYIEQLNSLEQELFQVGVELKDIHAGLVDFPAVHEGREVCLCWRYGEKQLKAWHEVDSGFAGRQALSLLDSTAQAAE